MVTRLLKQIQEAARQGKLHDYCKDFEPVAHLRPLKEVLAEYREHHLGGLAVVKAGCTDAGGRLVSGASVGVEPGRGERPPATRDILARTRANL